MKKRNPKKLLKQFSWTYLILAIFILIFIIVVNLSPSFEDTLKKYINEENPVLVFNTLFIVSILIYLWYFWLSRRVADGKSKGTLYMILLSIGAIGGIVAIFTGTLKGSGTFDLALNLVGLYFVWNIRKQEK